MFTVEDGRITRDGVPFVALGVNYHPSQAGCRIWSDWNGEALAADFKDMAAAGLNTVRLFLFWREAQPAPDEVSALTLERLRVAVAHAHDAGLVCVISLFTIWMNGQLLDLPWRAGRDLWRDGELLLAEELLARKVARTLRGAPGLLAYDLGDELWHIDPAARSLSRDEVAAWQERLAGVLRQESPGVLVLQANDASGVFGGVPYGSDNSAGLDLIGTHGFPSWAPGSIESTLSYRATSLVPFLVGVGRAYGAPLVDEFGSYGVAERTCARYSGAALASAVGNGAAGVLVWCWKDIASTQDPYRERPLERLTGLYRLDGSPRPALRELRRVAQSVDALTPYRPGEGGAPGTAPEGSGEPGVPPAGHRQAGDIALYLPERVRGGGGSYLDGGGSAVATFHAYTLLKRAHLAFGPTAGEVAGRALVICPSVAHLTLGDLGRLTRAAEGGATVYLSMGDHLHAFPGTKLTGVEIEDVCGPEGKDRLQWGDESWPVDWTAVPTRPTRLAPAGATVLAQYPDGSPALTSHRVGRGTVVFTNAPFEAQLDRPGRLAYSRWERLYALLARRAEVVPRLECASPEIEVIEGVGTDGLGIVLINHSDGPVRSSLTLTAAGKVHRRTVELTGKDWTIWNPEGPRS